MYALLITIIVYATGGQILAASTTAVPGYQSQSSCEDAAVPRSRDPLSDCT